MSKCSAVTGKGDKCKNGGYYKLNDGRIVCGVHSRGKERVELPKIKKVLEKVEVTKGEGKIEVRKIQMMKSVEDLGNYARCFPNFKHGGRKDACFDCSSLSPFRLGPIDHGQPSLPPAKNLENFFQFNKVYSDEVDKNTQPTQKFFDTQLKGYLDEVPHRHKPQYKIEKCLYSIWEKKDKTLVSLSYVESRQIYSHFYVKYAREQEAFKKLVKLHEDGYNICIYGYDGYPTNDVKASDMEEYYLDPSKPFGHELVLYTMLKYKPEEYPWIKYGKLELN